MRHELEAGLTEADRPTFVAASRIKRTDKVGMTFYMSPATHTRMKEMATGRKTSLQQLVAEAVDEWFARQSEPAYRYKDE
jgi:predicted DNA-binding ribbon-helix-helix protein